MAREFAKPFYNSKVWQECRTFVYKRSGGLCERCLKAGLYTPGEVVHHIIPLTAENIKDPKITTDPANLMLLCGDCHAAMHRTHTDMRYRVLPDGSISPL